MNTEKTKILLAEDDENLGSLLREYLQAKSFEAHWLSDGEKAYKSFEKNRYDICILDIMMPNKDGITLAREIRMIDPEMPIIFLTAKSMKEDVLEGFSVGADDYMTKPFSIRELLARVRAIFRRVVSIEEAVRLPELSTVAVGDLLIDPDRRKVFLENEAIQLTAKEFDLLVFFARNPGSGLLECRVRGGSGCRQAGKSYFGGG